MDRSEECASPHVAREDFIESAECQPDVEFHPMPGGGGQRADSARFVDDAIERPEFPPGRRKTLCKIAGRSKIRHTHGLLCSVLAHVGDVGLLTGKSDAARVATWAAKICEVLERSDAGLCACRRRRTREGRPDCPRCKGGGRRALSGPPCPGEREGRGRQPRSGDASPVRAGDVRDADSQPPFANRGVDT